MSAIFFPNSHCTKPVQARRGADLLQVTVAYMCKCVRAGGRIGINWRASWRQPLARLPFNPAYIIPILKISSNTTVRH
jgi:hypothetical protein